MSKVYISGPMRGIPKFNFPMFDKAQRVLESMGFDVINPAEHDRDCYPDIESWDGFNEGELAGGEFDVHQALKWDLEQVMHCDMLVLLPGWQHSEGAGHEKYIAEAVGVPVTEMVDDSVLAPGEPALAKPGQFKVLWDEDPNEIELDVEYLWEVE